MKVIYRGSTTKYSLFEMATGNREYSEHHAESLALAIKRRNLLPMRPIICVRRDNKLIVYDGQHRLAAAKHLGLPIYYEVWDSLSLSDVAEMNARQKGWNNRNFLTHFAQLGNKEYQTLLKFTESSGVAVGVAAQLIGATAITEGGGARRLASFRDGGFKVASVSEGTKIVQIMNAIRDAGCKFTRDRGFIKALKAVDATGLFDIHKLLLRLKYMPLEKRATWTQYVEDIDARCNYRLSASEKAPIAFRALNPSAEK